MLHLKLEINSLTAVDIMTKDPRSIDKDSLVIDALELMRKNNITQLPVISKGVYKGIIHLHDILKEGVI